MMNSLLSGAISAVPNPLVNTLLRKTCVSDAETTATTKKEYMLQITIGARVNKCITCDVWLWQFVAWGIGYGGIGISENDRYVVWQYVLNYAL